MLRIVSTRAAAMRPASRLSALGAVRSHCQVPCGIYNEQLRLDAMSEDAQTVRQRSPVLSVLLHPRRTAALTTYCPLRAPFR